MELVATGITRFIIVADVMNNGFAKRIHWQFTARRLLRFELIVSGFSCSISLSGS
jgi:hypothetical protein